MTTPRSCSTTGVRAVCLLLSRAAGLVFDESRRDSMGYSLGERLRATGIATVGEYLDEVCAPGSAERQRLIDEVTIQETHFFRNPPQMRALRAHVLPELIRPRGANGRRLRIWSAGCSTGEEPYTIAMMLRELLPSGAGWDVKVIATDISENALDAARAATYGARSCSWRRPRRWRRSLPALRGRAGECVPRSRASSSSATTTYRSKRRRTTRRPGAVPQRHHLLQPETTRALMGRLHRACRDGGYLILGTPRRSGRSARTSGWSPGTATRAFV
jgi:chemotaxis protein methyltransferase CheR